VAFGLPRLNATLPYDQQKAKNFCQRAVDLTNEPDGHYGLTGLFLEEVSTQREGIHHMILL
jgi:hypothetical protein